VPLDVILEVAQTDREHVGGLLSRHENARRSGERLTDRYKLGMDSV
jgi:hypothetical protein